MAWKVASSEFAKLPYIKYGPNDSRIIQLQPFYSEEESRFRMFVPLPDGKLVEMKSAGRPTQATYWSKRIVNPVNDIYVSLLYLIANNLSFPKIYSTSIGIMRDIYNFATLISRQSVLFEYCKSHPVHIVAIYNIFEIEIEYLMGLNRSFYGLLHNVLKELYKIYKRSQQLPDSLGKIADVGLEKAKEKYQLEKPIIEFLAEILPLFKICRKMRDDIYHHGKDTGIVFYTEYGPGISIDNPPFNEFKDFLENDPVYQNNLVEHNIGSLFYFFNKLISFALKSADMLAEKIKEAFELPQGLTDGYRLFLTGPDIKYLNEIDNNLQKCWMKLTVSKNELKK